ncbi:MAG: carbohydrate-binding family 9-like protein [Chitinophagia bacterium]|jgi:hypothetical protein
MMKFAFIFLLFPSLQDSSSTYVAKQLKGKPVIDAVWDKTVWKKAAIIPIARHMGPTPSFVPKVEAKMGYDQSNIYVIFQVKDKFVQSRILEYNGSVSTESCVEFFFAPDENRPLSYFNLEINAGGTPLIFYITKPMSEVQRLKKEEIELIEIAHSLPRVVYPEIQEPVTWTIECRIPISLLEKYTPVTRPEKGKQWKANFYKTGSRTSNPNYMTWALVDFPRPNFHLPQYFGTIQFK